MTDRAETLRKQAAERSRQRNGERMKVISRLCGDCGEKYEAPPGQSPGCPRCGATSKTGRDA